jgi:hypothetical protein
VSGQFCPQGKIANQADLQPLWLQSRGEQLLAAAHLQGPFESATGTWQRQFITASSSSNSITIKTTIAVSNTDTFLIMMMYVA